VGGIAVVVVILVASGCSKKSPPALATEQPSSAATTDTLPSGWKLEMKVTPDHPRMVRPATFTVHITDSAGKPVENAQLTGSLNMTLMDMGKTAVKFEPKGSGNYQTTVPGFDMSGPWELTVYAAQGTLHAHTVFPVTVFD
jgi:nitrogen fixation protein FixH